MSHAEATRSPLAIVTGSSRGLGRAIVDAFLGTADWDVVGVARHAPSKKMPARYVHRAVDLADAGAVQALHGWLEGEDLLADRPRVAVVHNAGVLGIGPLYATPIADLQREFMVNTIAPGWSTGAFLKTRALASTPTRIVLVSSGAAHNPYPGWPGYCASKAALRMLGQVVASELEAVPALAGRDARVICYEPGVVETEMQAQIRSASPEVFPNHARFVDLHDSGALVDPSGPAAEIVGLVGRDDLPTFHEARFSG